MGVYYTKLNNLFNPSMRTSRFLIIISAIILFGIVMSIPLLFYANGFILFHYGPVIIQAILGYYLAVWILRNSPSKIRDAIALFLGFLILSTLLQSLLVTPAILNNGFWNVLALNLKQILALDFISALGLGRILVLAGSIYLAYKHSFADPSLSTIPSSGRFDTLTKPAWILLVLAALSVVPGFGLYLYLNSVIGISSGWELLMAFAVIPILIIAGGLALASRAAKLPVGFFIFSLIAFLGINGFYAYDLITTNSGQHRVEMEEGVGLLVSQPATQQSNWSQADAYLVDYAYRDEKFVDNHNGRTPVRFANATVKAQAQQYMDQPNKLVVVIYDTEPLRQESVGSSNYEKIYEIRKLEDFHGEGEIGEDLVGRFINVRRETYISDTPGVPVSYGYEGTFKVKETGKEYALALNDYPESPWLQRALELSRSGQEVRIQTRGLTHHIGVNQLYIKWIYSN